LDFVGPVASGDGALSVVGGPAALFSGAGALAFVGPITSGFVALWAVAGRVLSGPGALTATVDGGLYAGRAPVVLRHWPVRLMHRIAAVE